MTTLTAAPDPALARVRVVVDDGAGGTLERTGPDGVNVPVRAGEHVTGDRIVDDYEAPFGVPLTYRLDGALATAQLDTDRPWLTHPTRPDLSTPVRLVDDDPWEWSAPGTVHELVEGRWPVVVWRPRTERTGTLRIAATWAGRATVEQLVDDGSPLLLRVPPGCYADDLWLWPKRVRRAKSSPHDPAAVRFDLAYQRVAPPGGTITLDPGNAWIGVPVEHATWQAVSAAHPDWVDVALTPHPHA